MSHIGLVESCPSMNLDGGLQKLHTAHDESVDRVPVACNLHMPTRTTCNYQNLAVSGLVYTQARL